MTWRTVVISNRAKLEYKMDSLIVRDELELKKIHLSEVSVLIVENTGVSLTTALLNELIKKKIKVIFCDEKRNPSFEVLPYYGSHDTSAKIKEQINWKDSTKGLVWEKIIYQKIYNQKELLKSFGKEEYRTLEGYLDKLTFYDKTNREGHAAKVYFNSLFGKEFSRKDSNNINAAMNYGYSIILSMINREIVQNGYITQIGIFHDNVDNCFNFGCDLMEPFRPLVDMLVIEIDELEEFSAKEKYEVLKILNKTVLIDNKNQTVINAIKIYCRSVFEALNKDDVSLIKFYKYEREIYESNCIL